MTALHNLFQENTCKVMFNFMSDYKVTHIFQMTRQAKQFSPHIWEKTVIFYISLLLYLRPPCSAWNLEKRKQKFITEYYFLLSGMTVERRNVRMPLCK
jgi:hypothetical protein